MSRMKICPKCGAIAEWDSYFGGTRCTRCDFVEKPKPSNADRIRSMTDEELAEYFTAELHDGAPSFTCPVPHPCPDEKVATCRECFLEWLQQEGGE